jgi:putative transposase
MQTNLNHYAYVLSFHLVLVTKCRRRCLTAAMFGDLQNIFAEPLEMKGGALLELDGEPDHIHLLIDVPPKYSLSMAVNNFKSVTSRLLRKRHAAQLNTVYSVPVLWSRSYLISSVGGASLEVVKHDIEAQQRPE